MIAGRRRDYSARASDSWSSYPELPITYNDITFLQRQFFLKVSSKPSLL